LIRVTSQRVLEYTYTIKRLAALLENTASPGLKCAFDWILAFWPPVVRQTVACGFATAHRGTDKPDGSDAAVLFSPPQDFILEESS